MTNLSSVVEYAELVDLDKLLASTWRSHTIQIYSKAQSLSISDRPKFSKLTTAEVDICSLNGIGKDTFQQCAILPNEMYTMSTY